MQNPKILKFIIKTTQDEEIRQLAKDKLKFTALTETETNLLQGAVNFKGVEGMGGFELKTIEEAEEKLRDGGTYSVHNPDFLTGANISICLTKDFMEAVERDSYYELKFPDTASYNKEEMKYYDEYWAECGDVRDWEKEHGMKVKTYRTIKAKELWNLVNICATYSAEPGIFFLDNANSLTNAAAYNQKVVATNPCGKLFASCQNRGMKRGA